MWDWIQSGIEEWIDGLFSNLYVWAEDVDLWISNTAQTISDIAINLNQLIIDFQMYIKFSTYYIYFSGGMIVILFILLLVQGRKLGNLNLQNEKILICLEEMKKEGGTNVSSS